MDEQKESVFLKLEHLVKVYPNGEKAVYDFNLDIDRNEFIVIVGPSGCGKSTTLRMVAGLEDISNGSLYLNGKLLNYKECKDRNMAIVFQNYALYPQMNVFDNIAFPLTINKYDVAAVNKTLLACDCMTKILDKSGTEIFGVFESLGKGDKSELLADKLGIPYEAAELFLKLFGQYKAGKEGVDFTDKPAVITGLRQKISGIALAERQTLAESGVKVDDNFNILNADGTVKLENRKLTEYEIKIKVYETAAKLDLIPYLDKLPKELSGGQMQRVALGRAIVKNVSIFLMDEPLSNLDAKLRLVMRSEIVKLHNRLNATTVYVTHDQTEAMTMATKIVVMSRGFIQQIGEPEVIYNDPANIFVAKFIGSPAMNMFDAEFDREHGVLKYGELQIKPDRDFIRRHDEFYSQKLREFGDMQQAFGVAEREKILKILSATGEYADNGRQKSKKKNLFATIKEKLKKTEVVEDFAFEKDILAKKILQLQNNLSQSHGITVGVRPERIKIEKFNPSKKYENVIVVKPTVCELLGGEYSVHFDYCGNDMVGQFDAKEKITVKDGIAVWFETDDLYMFDPVSGNVIK